MSFVNQLMKPSRPWFWILLLFFLYSVAGFLIVPWIATSQIEKLTQERLGLETEIGEIALNPYLYEVEIIEFSARDSNDTVLLAFSRLSLDLELFSSLTSRALVIDDLEIAGLAVHFEQLDTETTNVAQILGRWEQTAAEPGPEAGSADPELSSGMPIILTRVVLEDGAIELVDRVPETDLELRIHPINIEIDNITTQPGDRLLMGADMNFADGGLLTFFGELIFIPELEARVTFDLENLSLGWTQSYIEPFLLAELVDGYLNLSGTIDSTLSDLFQFSGDLSVGNLDLHAEGETLLAWQNLQIPEIGFSLAESTLEIDRLDLDQPHLRFLVYSDGSTNLSNLMVDAEAPARAPENKPESDLDADRSDTDDGNPSEFQVDIGTVSLANGSALFADENLPFPFSAEISNLNGELSPVSTSTGSTSALTLTGQVGEFGEFLVGGKLELLQPTSDSQIDVEFNNVELIDTSPYLIKFAGREIDQGKLDLDLSYQISSGQLEASNNIVLREFTLGEDVDHPDAASLPLDLAIALLRDPDGVVDIDLPIVGDLNDPEFRIGGIVRQALVNLITGVVASPFRLLGNLVGAEDAGFDELVFRPGETAISPPELEKLTQLSEALLIRPQLTVVILPTINREADSWILRKELVDSRLDEMIQSELTETPISEQRRLAVETLYQRLDIAPTIESVAATHQVERELSVEAQVAGLESLDTPIMELDESAYLDELQSGLIDNTDLPDSALESLARERQSAVRSLLVEQQPELEGQIRTDTGIVEGSLTESGEIILALELDAR